MLLLPDCADVMKTMVAPPNSTQRGHGELPPMTCNSVRDNAQRGGHGAVRILWRAPT